MAEAPAMTPDRDVPTAGSPPAVPPSLVGAFGPLLAGVAGAIVLAGGAAAVVLVLVKRADCFPSLAAAGLVTVLASALSLVPQVIGLRRSLNAAVVGYFVAMPVRLGVSVVGTLLAVNVGEYPAVPTLLMVVGLYFAVLAAETAVVAVAAWRSGRAKV